MHNTFLNLHLLTLRCGTCVGCMTGMSITRSMHPTSTTFCTTRAGTGFCTTPEASTTFPMYNTFGTSTSLHLHDHSEPSGSAARVAARLQPRHTLDQDNESQKPSTSVASAAASPSAQDFVLACALARLRELTAHNWRVSVLMVATASVIVHASGVLRY